MRKEPTLIDECKTLRELEQQGSQSALGWKLLVLAPAMLRVLECFREGDAEIVELFANFAAMHKPDGHLNDSGRGSKIKTRDAVDSLRRLQKAAELMERKEESR